MGAGDAGGDGLGAEEVFREGREEGLGGDVFLGGMKGRREGGGAYLDEREGSLWYQGVIWGIGEMVGNGDADQRCRDTKGEVIQHLSKLEIRWYALRRNEYEAALSSDEQVSGNLSSSSSSMCKKGIKLRGTFKTSTSKHHSFSRSSYYSPVVRVILPSQVSFKEAARPQNGDRFEAP